MIIISILLIVALLFSTHFLAFLFGGMYVLGKEMGELQVSMAGHEAEIERLEKEKADAIKEAGMITVQEFLEDLDGAGLVITDPDAIQEELEHLGLDYGDAIKTRIEGW